MALVGYGLALGQDISFYKTEYKVGCICCITRFPIDLHGWTCPIRAVFGLPALIVLATLVVYFGSVFSIPLLVATILLIWGAMSAMGFFLSSHMLHMRNATQVISFVNVILAVLPPVFYSMDVMPDVLRLAYAVPTTHASLMLHIHNGPTDTRRLVT